jgi:hypothetical protein
MQVASSDTTHWIPAMFAQMEIKVLMALGEIMIEQIMDERPRDTTLDKERPDRGLANQSLS